MKFLGLAGAAIAALIAAVIVTTVKTLGTDVNKAFGDIAAALKTS